MTDKRAALSAIIGAAMMLVAGCGGTAGDTNGTSAKMKQKAYAPHINPADFTTKIDNKYFPLKPGTTLVYRGKAKDATEGDIVNVTSDTRNIMGVDCVVVDDRVTEDGELTEQTYDWYAQDQKGNVWYFGENSKEYNNGHVVSTEGSWEAGRDGAKPGVIMPADPKIGQAYRQEYYEGEAEDLARVLKLNGSAEVPYGSFENVLVTDEWTPLEPKIGEHKYYAPGVGNVLEVAVKGPQERLELVEVKRG
jgi:hypothetical protein